MSVPAIQFDSRGFAMSDRAPAIVAKLDVLAANETLELVMDGEPGSLEVLLSVHRPGMFSWQSVDRGPDFWRARVTRLGSARGTCCGACGGA